MSLPQRKPKDEKVNGRWRSDAHRKFVSGTFCCAMCGRENPVEAAHVSIGSDPAMGMKPDDHRVVPLCGTTMEGEGCHQRQHRVGERTFWREYEAAHGQTVEQLIASLCHASPKRAEIERVKRERAA